MKLPCPMLTDIKTGPAGRTFIAVHLNVILSVLINGHTGAGTAADTNALVAADTFFVCIN